MKKTRIPENFEVSSRIMELARQNAWPDPRGEIDAFKDHHLAHGSLMADWEAAFRTWLRKAKNWGKGKPIRTDSEWDQKEFRRAYILTHPEPKLTPEQRQENRRKVQELIDGLAQQKRIEGK